MSVLDILKKFHGEAIAFWNARAYLISIEMEAVRGNEPVKRAHDELVASLKPVNVVPENYFKSRLFISLVASFELFLQEIMAAVIVRHPKKVGNVQFKLSEILDSEDRNELVQRAIEEMQNKLMYKKPLEYLSDVADLLSINKSIMSTSWPIFVEAKARRDLGVHNNWLCNQTYMRKLTEAKITTTFSLGDSTLPSDDQYVKSVADTLHSLAQTMTLEIIKKYKDI